MQKRVRIKKKQKKVNKLSLGDILRYVYGTSVDVNELIWTIASVFILGSSLIQVAPIKVNPWTHIGKGLKRFFNGEISDKLTCLEYKIDQLEIIQTKISAKLSEQKAEQCKHNIIAFGNDIIQGIQHNHEAFNLVLDDITYYNQYCSAHPNYLNSKTDVNTKVILERYAELYESREFK